MLESRYPERPNERDRWILSRRPPHERPDPHKPQAFLIERERAESGEVVPVATVFLTNRACAWHCLMCDLWRFTTSEPVAPGVIPAQIDLALRQLPEARQIKLYNSGSFFDPQAIPPADHDAIAERLKGFDRVIVESHPALVGEESVQFAERLGGKLELAMGLETAHPEVLERLNKRMTLDQFRRAADFLHRHRIALRVFVLVKPPFLDEEEALLWAKRSINFAFECHAGVVSLIPTRLGNGALEALAVQGQFSPPRLATLESATAYGVGLRRGRVFADLWDLERLADCAACFGARADRLREMNFVQTVPAAVKCPRCGGESHSSPRA